MEDLRPSRPGPPPKGKLSGWHDRLGPALSAVRSLGCTSTELVALVVLVTGALAAAGLLWLLARPAPIAQPKLADTMEISAEQIVVHVAGQVVVPGVYTLDSGARVGQAVQAAGGPLPDAALATLNLARPLQDGEQVYVPAIAAAGGDGEQLVEPGQAAVGTGAPSAVRPDGLLDLNRATRSDLEALPGIGPVLAQRILDQRELDGGFQSVGDLRDVPGIGEAKFQQLAPKVAV